MPSSLIADYHPACKQWASYFHSTFSNISCFHLSEIRLTHLNILCKVNQRRKQFALIALKFESLYQLLQGKNSPLKSGLAEVNNSKYVIQKAYGKLFKMKGVSLSLNLVTLNREQELRHFSTCDLYQLFLTVLQT